jgi:ribonucleotide reductase alpha subunit
MKKQTPWGQLGYITFKRTYSRRLDENNPNSETEEFSQSVDRVIKACKTQLKCGFSETEEEELKSIFLNLKGSVAGRFWWQLGTKTVGKLGLLSLQNCFSSDTEFMTKSGIKKFSDFTDGDSVTIRARRGWKAATVKSFGKAYITELTLQKGSKRIQTIKTTGNHRWILEDNSILTTEQLKVGQVLHKFNKNTNFHYLETCPIGIQHGLVFGDGNYNDSAQACSITICGDSVEETRKFFFSNRRENREITGLPSTFKTLPDLSMNKQYLLGFLSGWFAADGSIGSNGSNVTLASSTYSELEWARSALSLLCISTSEINMSREISPFDGTVKPLYRITIDRENLPKEFFLLSKHSERFKLLEIEPKWKVISVKQTAVEENVFCVTEPENEEFTLGNGILTKNCAFTTVDSTRAFTWAMDALMLGSGVGFNIQREFVYQLPKAKKAKITRLDTNDADFIISDKREGWIKLLECTLKSHFETGKDFTYSTVLVRGKGTPIKGFGGTASGPEELCTGIAEINRLLNSRAGKKIRPIDALDIMNLIGSIVVAGNVRRSAEIAIGDSDDLQYLASKRWDLGNIPNYRAMSNNSVVCNDIETLPEQFWEGYKGNGEPFGLINLALARKMGRLGETQYPDPEVAGFNPCQPEFATVLTPEGVRQFKDISEGSTIWSKEGWTIVTKKWSTGVKKVFSFKTTGGEFIGTENHRVDTRDGKLEVSEAMEILTIAGPTCGSIKFDNQIVMDGLFLGDGYNKVMIGRDYVYPTLIVGKNDGDYFKSDVSLFFISKLQDRATENCEEWRVKTTISVEEKNKAHLLVIPDRYYLKNTIITASLLRGLYSADRSVVVQKGSSVRVTYKTASKVLSEQIQQMLSSLGIRSYITTNLEKQNEFKNGTYTCKESYDVNITKDVLIFYKTIGFLQDYKMEKISRIVDTYKPTKSDTFTSKKETAYLGEFEVFDITVNNNSHTYWTGGLSVSNCAEQSLAPYETCCLAEIFLPNISSKEELIKVATYLYRINKHSLSLPCHLEETESIVHKNMRMGIGVTGYLQATEEQRSWLSDTYTSLREFDKTYSQQKGWPESIKLTTVKPSGTLSLLAGVTSGVHPAYSQYMIRRIRIASNSPLANLCRKHGYHSEYQKNFDGTEDKNTVVVSFPVAVPDGTVLAKDLTAINQLEYVKRLQTEWSDNAVSCTVYYKKEELEGIRGWLKKNYNNSLKTVSFLLHNEHGFKQAPLEEITKEQYEEYAARVQPITSGDVNESDMLDSFECVGGVCPIK